MAPTLKKTITGSRDAKRFQVIKGSSDTREIRCIKPRCKNVARQVADGKGGFICQCLTCGAKFTFSKI